MLRRSATGARRVPLSIPAIRPVLPPSFRVSSTLALLILLSLLHCAETPVGTFRCPMHPDVLTQTPGECPVCGMALVEVATVTAEAAGDADVVVLAPEAIRLAGIRSEAAVAGGLSRNLRLQGFVVPDPSRQRHVVSRIGGWLEEVHVKASGVRVRSGDPLYTILAPDLLPLQEQYVLLLRSRDGQPQEGQAPVRNPGGEWDARLEVVRKRMRIYDLPDTLTADLERGGRPRSSIVFPAPASGFVRLENLFAGRQIEPNTEMMTITDLSAVWVEAELFEADIPGVGAGQEAVVTVASNPGWRGACRIAALAPSLDAVKGTLKAWVGCPNDAMVLKPGMTALIETPMHAAQGVLVPSSSVLSEGATRVVYVEGESGRFARREVVTGLRDGEKIQILSGVAAGDMVVARGAFLVDAERRLRARARSAAAGTAVDGDATASPEPAVAEAIHDSLDVPLQAAGSVTAIPDRIHHVVIRTMGWVRTLDVRVPGTRVRAGEVLFSLDAPDLVPLQEEYILAITGATQNPAAGSGQGTGVEGALGRLRRHGVQESFIRDLEKKRIARQVIPFVAPIAGYVTLDMVYEGQRVEPGMELMVVTDLSTVWVEANLRAAGFPDAIEGRKATVSLLYDPGVRHACEVIGYDPFLDPAARTMTLRVLCANGSMALRPGMSALVDLGAEQVEGVIVPLSAVVDTGMRQVAFVQDAQGVFQPRNVTVGARAGGRAQILSGLKAGERVAVSGSFLLDPDARVPAEAAGSAR